jgi:parallel beta-helix repeat protein
MSETPSLPRSTVSVALFLQTCLLFASMSVLYFLWYMPSDSTSVQKYKEVYVLPEDNLEQMLQNVQEPTCFLLSPALRKGDLRINGKSNLILKGNGKAGEVIFEGISETAILLEDCNDIRLENINLRNQNERYPALRLSHSNKVVVENTNVQSSGVAVHVHAQCYDVTISKSNLSGKLEVSDSRRLSLTGNRITADNTALTDPVVQMQKVVQVSLDNNHIKGITGLMFSETVAEKGYQNCIYKNSVNAAKHSVNLENCSDFLFTLNTIESENGPAVALRKCTNMQIGKEEVKNTIKTMAGKAFDASGCNDIVICGNWLNNRDGDNDKQPVYAMEIGSCRHVDILHNEISGFARYEEATQVVQDLKGGGLLIVNSPEVVLRNNHIFRGICKGIYAKKMSEVTIAANRVEDNGDSGIEIENSKFTIGPDNVIARNITGIVIRDSEGSIGENHVSKNQREGIVLENYSGKINKNKIYENGSDGISLKRNSMPELQQNEFIKNQGHAIAFWQLKVVNWKNANIFRDNLKGDSNK